VEKGPGLWVLNNTVLFNEIYEKRVKEIIASYILQLLIISFNDLYPSSELCFGGKRPRIMGAK
jgi:hypothetical protein